MVFKQKGNVKPKSDGSLEKLADKAAEEKFTHCGHFYEHPELPTQIGITQQELKNTILSALSEATAALEEKVKNLENETRSPMGVVSEEAGNAACHEAIEVAALIGNRIKNATVEDQIYAERIIQSAISETSGKAYGRGVTAGKLEALKYTPEERERYRKWIQGISTPTPVLQVSEAEELANATTRSPRDE